MIRVFDIIFALLGLFFFSWLFLIVFLLVKLGSKGPVFYKQIRIGKDGQEFKLIKFRTMHVNADKNGLMLTLSDRDPRITPIGLFLRRYKLDELPQLFNVVAGQMSLVGPRPEVKKYVDLYSDEQRKILNIRPGITDIASIRFKNENRVLGLQENPEQYYVQHVMQEKIKLNQYYYKNPTIRKYFKIIFLTIKNIVV